MNNIGLGGYGGGPIVVAMANLEAAIWLATQEKISPGLRRKYEDKAPPVAFIQTVRQSIQETSSP